MTGSGSKRQCPAATGGRQPRGTCQIMGVILKGWTYSVVGAARGADIQQKWTGPARLR